MRSLIFAVGGLWLLFQVVLTAYWTGLFDRQTWPLTILYCALAVFTFLFLPKHLRLAQLGWLVGLGAIFTTAVVLLQRPEIVFLYALLPFIAVVVTNWQVGMFFIVGIAGCLWWFTGGTAPLQLSPLYAAFTLLACAVTTLIGWASARVVLTVIQWSLHGFSQAQRHTEEARQHRAELVRLYKDLDQAYYQLERTNSALMAARQVAEDAERTKTEFVTNVSHELRTPLNLIVGFTEMIMTAPESYGGVQLPKAYRGDLDSVYHSAQHLLALVDDVLDLARIEVGKIALVREEVDLHELVLEACNIVRDYIGAKGLALRIQVAHDLPPLWLDRLRIRQVLLNLLVNAARHTEQGRIDLNVSHQANEVIMRVTDTGPGIPREDLDKIFEEFRTTERPYSEWHSGTGLGLPISKKFVQLHDGQMGVESKLGEGASFWFTLPYVKATSLETATRTQEKYSPLVQLNERERLIVVVHEDLSIPPLLKRYLNGYQVIGVTTALEGVRLAEELEAAALVIDAKRHDLLPLSNQPVIRCPLPDGRTQAFADGVQEVLVKPISRQELLAAVDRIGVRLERALIVDDNPEIVQLFRRMLRARIPVHHCRESYSGVEALQLMQEERPDLVLLDLMMPDMDGRSVVEEMRQDPALADVPVILITARGQDYVNMRLSGPIEIQRKEGFDLGEIVQCLAAICDVLTPGWQALSPTNSAHLKDHVDSLA